MWDPDNIVLRVFDILCFRYRAEDDYQRQNTLEFSDPYTEVYSLEPDYQIKVE